MHDRLAFIETPIFTRRLTDLTDDPDGMLRAIQQDLLENPTRWPVIRRTGGARKGRIGRSQGGKSGGLRYVYVYVEHRGRVYLMLLFAKNEQTDLTSEQRRRLRELTTKIKRSRS